MKGLRLLFFTMLLVGCGHQESKDQPPDLEKIEREQLEFSREATKELIPNSDSAKFRNQIGECGEVSYTGADNNYIPFQRFIVVEENMVFIENQTDQKQFELSWKSSCTPNWKKKL